MESPREGKEARRCHVIPPLARLVAVCLVRVCMYVCIVLQTREKRHESRLRETLLMAMRVESRNPSPGLL